MTIMSYVLFLIEENHSLSNARPSVQVRSVSASAITQPSKISTLNSNETQRLKHVRRHQPVHVLSGAGSFDNISFRQCIEQDRDFYMNRIDHA
jgi:hypothetical protein